MVVARGRMGPNTSAGAVELKGQSELKSFRVKRRREHDDSVSWHRGNWSVDRWGGSDEQKSH